MRALAYAAVTALTASLVAVGGAAPASAVIGGHDASEDEVSHLIGLHFTSIYTDAIAHPDLYADPIGDSQFCGGTLVTPVKVVTAAHCVYDEKGNELSPSDLLAGNGPILLQNTGYTFVNVTSIDVFSEYATTQVGDIAVLTLAETLPNAVPIPVAVPWEARTYTAGTKTLVSGWGVVKEASGGRIEQYAVVAQTGVVKVAPSAACGGPHPRSYRLNGETIKPLRGSMLRRQPAATTICALGFNAKSHTVIDTCQGDSGGPMIDPSTNHLIGVVSWGRGCANLVPAAYTNVANYFDFLQSAGAVTPDAETEPITDDPETPAPTTPVVAPPTAPAPPTPSNVTTPTTPAAPPAVSPAPAPSEDPVDSGEDSGEHEGGDHGDDD